jgi:hypothetical protein
MMTPAHEPAHEDNIQLCYRMAIYILPDLETVLFGDSAEVFQDEHGRQWIKFFAKNGSMAGEEHMILTDKVMIVRQR